jgi:hypothetical protein
MTCENGIVDIRWAIATFYNLLSQYHFLSAIRPCLGPQPTMRFAELIAKSLDARRIMPRLACAPADRGEKKPRVLGVKAAPINSVDSRAISLQVGLLHDGKLVPSPMRANFAPDPLDIDGGTIACSVHLIACSAPSIATAANRECAFQCKPLIDTYHDDEPIDHPIVISVGRR